MKNPEKRELLYAAIQQYGQVAQLNQVIEECAELIQAINKFRRNPTSETILQLCGEIADVEIMCEQARLMFAAGDMVEDIKAKKLERLKNRLLTEELV